MGTSTLSLLYKKEYVINSYITINIPTLGQVVDNEDEYYNMVSLITAMPIDMIAELDDIGIDFTKISEYELFLLMFQELQKQKHTDLIFKDLDLTGFEVAENTKNETMVLYDKKNNRVIDRLLYEKIAYILRKVNHLTKNTKKPANEEARKYLLERAKKKRQRHLRRKNYKSSELESLIVALVNTEQFHYDFEGIRNLTIYQFNESVRQVIKKIDYDNLMRGIYAGTVSAKEQNPDALNWLVHN